MLRGLKLGILWNNIVFETGYNVFCYSSSSAPFLDFALIFSGTHGLFELYKIWDNENKWTTEDSEFAQFAGGMSKQMFLLQDGP